MTKEIYNYFDYKLIDSKTSAVFHLLTFAFMCFQTINKKNIFQSFRYMLKIFFYQILNVNTITRFELF